MMKIKSNPKIFFYSAIFFLAVFFAFFERQTHASEVIPEIIPRSIWGASQATPNWPVEYSNAEKFVIHHTASSTLTPDSDGSGRYTDMVESIYNYHSEKKTWYDDDGEYVGFGDIGYNYVIDPNGNIYEGRAGGNGSVGGHVRGFNEGSVGISVLGRYQGYVNSNNENVQAHPVTNAILDSLKKLIGWLASANKVDLNNITEFHGKNIDGLVGHRDLSATICPGIDLYNALSDIQDNASSKKNEFDKYAYQIPGNQSVYVLDDGFKLRFNSSQDLPSAYRDKNIIAASKNQLDLFRYKDSKIYPDGSLLMEFGTSAVYYIENQEKRHLNMSGAQFAKMGFGQNDTISVFKSDLNLYKEGKDVKYGPDGKLLKDANSNIYLIENGKKKKFTSAKLFELLGYKWNNVANDENINSYLSSEDMLFPDISLVTTKSDYNVYYIENKQKRKITSDILFKKLGFKEKNIISIESAELAHFPSAKNMFYPDNTLIQKENSPSVYLVMGGGVRVFPSAALFTKLGYKWKDVLKIKEDEFKNYALIGKVLQPNGSLIRFSDSPQIYFVEKEKRRAISSSEMFAKYGFKWSDVIMLPAGDVSEYLSGEDLKYPSGTLVKKETANEIYRIEGGQLKEFTSQTLFERSGGKWNEIIAIPEEAFSSYSYGGIVTYPEKTLLREKGKDGIYVMKGGKAEGIRSLNEFNKAGYKWKNVVDVPGEELLYQMNPTYAYEKRNAIFAKTSNSASTNSKAIAAPLNNSNNKPEDAPNVSGSSGNIPSDPEQSRSSDLNNPNIRIAIYSISDGSVSVAANGPYSVNYFNSDGTLQKKENKNNADITEIKYFNSSSYIKFIPENSSVILEISSYSDPSWNKSVNDNKFRGNIELKYSSISNRLWIINELRLEDYVNGIAEASSDSPGEYLKAFGTITRTYAMYYIKRGGKHAREPFHLKNSRLGNGNDQSYKGYNFEMRAGNIIAANNKTFGKIITFKEEPIVAAYSSDSGGITKNACDVISKSYCTDDYSYLSGGINDPAETIHDQNKVSISHGAGMSAVGAVQMAKNGSTWENIIAHYYPGIKIDKFY